MEVRRRRDGVWLAETLVISADVENELVTDNMEVDNFGGWDSLARFDAYIRRNWITFSDFFFFFYLAYQREKNSQEPPNHLIIFY